MSVADGRQAAEGIDRRRARPSPGWRINTRHWFRDRCGGCAGCLPCFFHCPTFPVFHCVGWSFV